MGKRIVLIMISLMIISSSTIFVAATNQRLDLENTITNEDKLTLIQQAIKDKDADWIAGYNTVFTKQQSYVNQYVGLLEDSTEETQETAPLNTNDAPSSYDWRDVDGKNWITSVKSQGGCGSCVAFGSLGALEAVVQIESDVIFDCDLSESQLFFCGGGRCGFGWYNSRAVSFIQSVGVVDELCFPYHAYDTDCDEKQANWQQRLVQVTNTGSYTNNQQIKEALVTYGPLLTGFSVYEDFGSYNGGIYEHVWGSYEGGHAVAIVGYNDDPGYWICKNSWSKSWGDEGFFNIKYNECGIDNEVFYFDGITGNIQPTKPEIIQPYQGDEGIDTTITLQWDAATDVDGDEVSYSIYLEEGRFIHPDSEPLIKNLQANAYTVNNLKKNTLYSWLVISEDAQGAQHMSEEQYFVTRPPAAPLVNGPSVAKAQKQHTYTAYTTEHDGNQYYWFFSWGDEETSGWLGPYDADEQVSASHTWKKEGTYEIKVKYKEDNVVSEWGSISITMPKPNRIDFSLLNQLLQRYPLMQKLFYSIQ